MERKEGEGPPALLFYLQEAKRGPEANLRCSVFSQLLREELSQGDHRRGPSRGPFPHPLLLPVQFICFVYAFSSKEQQALYLSTVSC